MKYPILALLLCSVAVGQGKPWKPSMCTTPVMHASRDYVLYCVEDSEKYPKCPMSSGSDGLQRGEKGAYFEVLDCSWHGGESNPRDSFHAKKSTVVKQHDFAAVYITADSDPATSVLSKPEPMNVPAIAKVTKELVPCGFEVEGCALHVFSGDTMGMAKQESVTHWTCPPGHWQLNHTEDGEVHWCSSPPVMEEP